MGNFFRVGNFHQVKISWPMQPRKFVTEAIRRLSAERNCVRGYYMYKNTWEAAVGETLSCMRESRNARNRYAIAVEKDATVVGHLPRKVSRDCALLLK